MKEDRKQCLHGILMLYKGRQVIDLAKSFLIFVCYQATMYHPVDSLLCFL